MSLRTIAFILLTLSALGRPARADLGSAEAVCKHGLELEQLGDTDGALRQYHAALAMDSNYVDAWRLIGYCQANQHHNKEALAAFDQYLLGNPTDLTVREYTDQLRMHQDDPEPTSTPAPAPTPVPEQPQAGAPAFVPVPVPMLVFGSADDAFRRGAALETAGDAANALLAYEAALALRPDYGSVWRQVGNCYARSNQPREAVRAYDRYLSLHPEDAVTQRYAEGLRRRYHLASARRNALEHFEWEQRRAQARLERETREQAEEMEEQPGAEAVAAGDDGGWDGNGPAPEERHRHHRRHHHDDDEDDGDQN